MSAFALLLTVAVSVYVISRVVRDVAAPSSEQIICPDCLRSFTPGQQYDWHRAGQHPLAALRATVAAEDTGHVRVLDVGEATRADEIVDAETDEPGAVTVRSGGVTYVIQGGKK